MRLDPLADRLRSELKGRVDTDLGLARFTTYRLGGPAALFVEPAGTEDLEALGGVLRDEGLAGDELPVLALGRGSNLLVADTGFPGLVVRMGSGFSWIRPWDPNAPASGAGDPSGLAAGAATSQPQVANWAARRGLAGFEWAIAIPGSIGGAVRMNAGAHDGSMSECLADATIWNMATFEMEERTRDELGFGYRYSSLGPRDLVVAARLALTPDDPATIRKCLDDHRRHRAETQPGALQNAGSTFKNPPGDSAGRLVEAAGLKGFRVGGASVSQIHANFFVATDSATAQDVHDLVGAVRSRVKERFGVDLEPEVRFIGDFSARAGSAGAA
ncbi:MAG: UDP-N-acetylmuramate dehydrogenase [Actinomycetota bacterium]